MKAKLFTASSPGSIGILNRLSPLTRPLATQMAPAREALKAACDQMQVNRNNVFGGRRVYFTEDPDIKVVYCLVRTPQPTDMPEVEVSDPPLVDTVELLFMSYYGEPLDKGL